MLFCPQFSFSLTNNYDAFHYFHHTFGAQICMLICGTIFLGTGAIFASYLLSEGEFNKVKASPFLYYTALSIIAVSIFMLFGAEVYFSLLIFWFIGATLSGALLFKVNGLIRYGLST